MRKNSTAKIVEIFNGVVDFSEMTVKVRNEFHQTETYMAVNAKDETVSSAEVDRVASILCGMPDCSCHSIFIDGDSVVDMNGDHWKIK